LPETSQNGIKDATIQYPDVVSWSPNPQVPRIAFDAFNNVPFGPAGSSINYWSMYEIDFAAERIYNLIPGQPTNITVGNVTYSNTNPDLIAFNVLDEQGIWDVIVGNFETGGFTALELSSYTLNNIPITDGLRPTFAPDDSFVSFTSPDLGVMLFSDGTNAPSFLDFGAPIYNPHWFVRSGSGGSQNRAPSAQFSFSGNSGTAPFLVGLDASASFDPDGDDLTYRWDFGDGSVSGSVTAAHTYAARGTFTLTLTVTDSGGLSSSTSTQVQVNDSGVAVEDEASIPTRFALAPNYPNPFNPATTIAYDLPASAEVNLTVYDLYGRKVATLVQAAQGPGRYEVTFQAQDLASGVYVYRLTAGDFTQTQRMVLMK
jgi:PKD repeat protein